MKMLTRIALIASLVSVFVQGYLTKKYYPLQFGAGEASVCNIGGKFNCDAVSASSYSAIMGIPVSIFGLVVNLILFGLILIAFLEWTERPERMRRWTLALAGMSAFASLVMGAISLFLLGNYCIFCILLYALSFIIFECVRRMLSEPFWSGIKNDLPYMWAENQNILGAFVAIPIVSLLIHQGFMTEYGASNFEQAVGAIVNEWSQNEAKEFATKPLVAMGAAPDQAKMTIKEFADFRCHHCKNAVASLHSFTKANSDVRFEFYVFPLEGECELNSPKISCFMASSVYCAEVQGKGWQMHDAAFAAQEEVNDLANADQVKSKVMPRIYEETGVDIAAHEKCLADPATTDAIRAQAKQGELNGIHSTPSIWVNQKLLPRGQALPVLKRVKEKILGK